LGIYAAFKKKTLEINSIVTHIIKVAEVTAFDFENKIVAEMLKTI
jgi:hypothetical protein